MFVQVIEGQVADRECLRRQLERRIDELRQGGTGFVGATAGVTDDGHAIALVRFESATAARAYDERPEHGRWLTDTRSCFAGHASFTLSDDVELFRGGGSDRAGFVQVMKGSGIDREQMRVLDQGFEEHGADLRPDFLGALRAWTGPDSYIEVAYFTNEAEARAGEEEEPPPELADLMGDFQQLMTNVQFLDLRDPWLY